MMWKPSVNAIWLPRRLEMRGQRQGLQDGVHGGGDGLQRACRPASRSGGGSGAIEDLRPRLLVEGSPSLQVTNASTRLRTPLIRRCVARRARARTRSPPCSLVPVRADLRDAAPRPIIAMMPLSW
jgi:hypothetical protein